MRKIIFCAIVLSVTAQSFCQQPNPHQPITQNDYLTKSKNQKTAAWVLLGGGVALLAGGVLWLETDLYSNGPFVLWAIGGAAMIGSIPLFIASAKNKRKAMKASIYLEIQHLPVVTQRGGVLQTYPALSLRIAF